MKTQYFISVMVAGLLLFGCAKPSESVVKMELTKLGTKTVPQVSQETSRQLTKGNTEFAFAFYTQNSSGAGNLFFSPQSISMAFAMVFIGARGETEKQISQALRFKLGQSELHPAFAAQNDAIVNGSGKDFTLNVVNGIWAQRGASFEKEFFDTLIMNYRVEMRVVDFVTEAEKIRLEINGWVEAATAQKIKDLLLPGTVDATTKLVIVNAVYFLADWATPFTGGSKYPFYDFSGGEKNCDMIQVDQNFKYMEDKDYQAVEIPYKDPNISMIVILPKKGDETAFHAFEKRIVNREAWEAMIAKMTTKYALVMLPKFKFEWGDSIVSALQSMGIEDAFQDGIANFAGISPSREFFISEVIHKAFVAVDEKGTEAAAATAIVMKESAMGPKYDVWFVADHPFIFAICHKSTGAILFLGRLTKP